MNFFDSSHGRRMTSRIVLSLVVCSGLVSSASAQVVRFETTQGDFDMVLNPTNNPVLQGHVDNMLRYIDDNKYLGSWINRADTGFVLQMGGFFAHTKRPGQTQNDLHGVQQFNEIVEGEPAAETGLSNTTGTVALALSGGQGGTNQDSGSSSFFVNVADTNTFLDADFTVFAAIPDMTTINKIMALTTRDLTQDPNFGADPSNLAFSDVPLDAGGKQVFIKRAFVISDTLATAQAMAGIQSVVQNSAAAASSGLTAEMPALTSAANLAAGGSASASAAGPAVVPEPASAALAVFAALSLIGMRRSR
jgi:cyclophilin family peptidyl-prolyl cis-trans isomerase